MGIGDLESSARGTGSRANDGKTPYELLPMKFLFDYAQQDLMPWWDICLSELGAWQAGDDTALLRALMTTVDGHLGLAGFEPAARVFGFGAKKYKAFNWAKGMPWSVPYACACRHIEKLQMGEELDRDSLLHHRGHVQCNLIMLVTFATTYRAGDDRPDKSLFTGSV